MVSGTEEYHDSDHDHDESHLTKLAIQQKLKETNAKN